MDPEEQVYDQIVPGFSATCLECRENNDICCVHMAQFMQDNGEPLWDTLEFSRSMCDLCKSLLAGVRYAVHAHSIESDTWEHLEICVDCFDKHCVEG